MTKRNEILASTLNLVSELGLQATSIQHIIKKADVAAGTIYHYFDSKDDLFDTLYSEIKEELGKAISINLTNETNYKNKFFMICNNLFQFNIQNQKKFLFLEDYANTPLVRREIKEITQQHFKEIIDYFNSGLNLGIFRNIPVDLMINIVFGHIAVFSKMILYEEIQYTNDLLEKVIQASWDSIKIN